MPEKILPTLVEYEKGIRDKLLELGFRSITKREVSNDFERLDLFSRNPKKGKEEGFIFYSNGLKAIVWTTFVLSTETARDEDLGWVLIAKGDRALYFSHPFRRTKNFAENLLNYARIAKERVLNRPLCSECKRQMDIAQGRGIRARYWICTNWKNHENRKSIKLTWDAGLSKDNLAFLKKERDARRKYIAKRRKAGKNANVAPLIRSGMWRVRRSDNLVS